MQRLPVLAASLAGLVVRVDQRPDGRDSGTRSMTVTSEPGKR